jgi:DNA repair exonuclease SbcCD nuclease subunit
MSHKILAIGDPHFRTDNVEETQSFSNELKKYLERNDDVEVIIVLGDILHTHEKLHTDALNTAVNFFKMLVSFKKNTFVLVGNHDATSNSIFLTTNHWLNILKEWGNITVVDYPTKFVLSENKDVFITMCPYVPEGRLVEALDLVKDWEKSTIVFGHQTLNGAKMGAITADNVEEWKDDYPMLISGHVHDKQRVKHNLYYAGSSLQHSYGEGSDKSLCLITVEDGKIKMEDVYLTMKRKKIVYADVDQLEEVSKNLNEGMEYKIVLKGSVEEFKALKKSSLFKDAMNLKNVKNITFKSKAAETVENTELGVTERDKGAVSDDFCEHLDRLVRFTNDNYLISFYEHVMFNKEDISGEDIIILE